MGINQELLSRLLLGATVRAEVPAAHTHKGRDKCKEPEPKAAVHRSHAKTNGPQEHARDRQLHLPKGSRARRENKPQRRRDQQTHARSAEHSAGHADGPSPSSP